MSHLRQLIKILFIYSNKSPSSSNNNEHFVFGLYKNYQINPDNKSNKHILITILLFSLKEEEQIERIFPGNQKLGTKRKVGRKLSIALHPNLLILNPPVLLERNGAKDSWICHLTGMRKEERERDKERAKRERTN